MARPIDPNRRADILRAARAVLLEHGYLGARIGEIAERAGVATGTVYLYFDSKEVLVLALLEDFFTRLADVVLPVLDRPDVSQAIAEAVRAALAFAADERDLLKLAGLEVGLNKLSQYHPLPARVALHERLAQALAARMDEGQLRRYEPTMLAELLAGLIEWVAEASLIRGDGDPTRYEETVIRLLQHALLPREA
jgi:AcrR family transcriptional regulator